MIFKKRAKKQEKRDPHITYQRQQSYHYSAKRSSSDRLFGRGEGEPEKPAAKVKRRARKLPSVIAVILVLAGLLYTFTLSTHADITIQGDQQLLRDRAVIQAKTDEILKSTLKNKFKFTLNEQKVNQELRSKFPEFTSVESSAPLFRHRPHIVITLSKPAALLATEKELFLLDEQGRALFDTKKDHAGDHLDLSSLPIVQDQSSHKVEPGKPALSSSQVAYIHEVRVQSESKDLKVESMIMHGGGGQLDVRYTGLAYYVKYNFFEDARKSAGTFLAMKEHLEKNNIKPAEYVDVRIAERAYIR